MWHRTYMPISDPAVSPSGAQQKYPSVGSSQEMGRAPYALHFNPGRCWLHNVNTRVNDNPDRRLRGHSPASQTARRRASLPSYPGPRFSHLDITRPESQTLYAEPRHRILRKIRGRRVRAMTLMTQLSAKASEVPEGRAYLVRRGLAFGF
jgi:hypothetical protein